MYLESFGPTAEITICTHPRPVFRHIWRAEDPARLSGMQSAEPSYRVTVRPTHSNT